MMRRAVWEALSADERRAYADPSKRCIERGCDEPAGTPWGPLWCADHDDERIERVSRQLHGIADELRTDAAQQEAEQ